MNEQRANHERYLGWILLLLLLGCCLLVLRPFVTAMLWAAVLSFSLWPVYGRLLKALGGRRTLAAALLSLGMILVVLLPFVIVAFKLADNINDLQAATQRLLDAGLPAPPAWLAKLPLVGQAATEAWRNLAADSGNLLASLKRFVEPVVTQLFKTGMSLGVGLFQLALSILVTFFLLRNGAAVGDRLTDGAGRLLGERGKHLLDLAGRTVRGVVYGILGTALVQAVMAGIGFLIAGVPGAAFLALLTFFLSVVPVGPPLVWVPAVLWLFHQGATGWAIFMIVWGLGVSTVDNFVKPWLISQGSDMPFLLILFGVLGGVLAFGFIGVFIGPTLLAVGYRVVAEWSAASRPADSITAMEP
jgi:predicted PurR-regulated permease PerM